MILGIQSILGWAEIKTPVLAFMEGRKARRVSQEQRDRLSTRVAALRSPIVTYKKSLHPVDDFIPLISDVCCVPDILDTILTGEDESFTALTQSLPDRLPKLSAEMYKKRTEQIASVLPWDGATPDSLDLATAWFTCSSCAAALRHQEVFKHMCFRTRPPESTRPQEQLLEFTGNPWTWQTEKINFADGISKATRKVVLACGGDPDEMTYRELDEIPCRIAWFQTSLSLQVIDWRQLVRAVIVRWRQPWLTLPFNRRGNSRRSTRNGTRARTGTNRNGGCSSPTSSQSFDNAKRPQRRSSGRACTVGGLGR